MNKRYTRLKALSFLVLGLSLTAHPLLAQAADASFSNPGAETGDFTGWTQTVTGEPWIVSSDVAHSGTKSFVSANTTGYISRTVDLLDAGFTEAQIDNAVSITISAWVKGIGDGAAANDPYAIGIALRGAGGGAMLLHGTGWLTASSEWTQASVSWGNLPGMRLVSIDAHGYDTAEQSGNVGVAFDDFAITLELESTPPEIVSVTPESGETGVATSPTLSLSFSEPVIAASGNIVIYRASDDSAVATVDVTSGDVSGSETDTISIDVSGLRSNTEYYVTIDEGAFEDLSENAFEGISDSSMWTFTTKRSSRTPVSSDSSTNTSNDSTSTPTDTTDDQNQTPEQTQDSTQEPAKTPTQTTKPHIPLLPPVAVSPYSGLEEQVTPVEPGDYIRSPHFNTVYFVDEQLQRHPIPSEQIFFTWENSFSVVKTVTDATLSALSLGSPVLPKAGVVLIKMESVPDVFAVSYDDTKAPTLHLISDETLANALFGSSWADYVIDLPLTFFSKFKMGTPLTQDSVVDKVIMKRRGDLKEVL